MRIIYFSGFVQAGLEDWQGLIQVVRKPEAMKDLLPGSLVLTEESGVQ
jgi:hypothetical protein